MPVNKQVRNVKTYSNEVFNSLNDFNENKMARQLLVTTHKRLQVLFF